MLSSGMRGICLSKQINILGMFLILLSRFAFAQSWTELSPSGTPPVARTGTTGVYDPTSDRMIVFAGRDGSGNNRNDVWALTHANGEGVTGQWIRLIPNGATGSPPARSGHSAFYDSVNNRMIIFGGCSAYCAPVLNDVWVLTNANGIGGTTAWTQLSPGSGPPARTNAAAAYDPVNNQVYLFGGQDGGANPCSTFSDLWVLSNANGLGSPLWQNTQGLGPPAGQNGASMVIDPTTSAVTVFGGTGLVNGTCTVTNAVSMLLAGIWETSVPEGAAGSPPPRSFHSAVYDAKGGRMLVFGGMDGSANYLNDVWSLSNATGAFVGAAAWSMLSPTGGPPSARDGQAAIFDSTSRRMSIFGGSNASGVLGDSWILSAPGISGLSCSAGAGDPFVRAEGIAEQMGGFVLYCTGGTPTPEGMPIPEYTITLTLDVDVSSRLLAEGGGLSEALLLIDQPYPATPVPSYVQPTPGAPPQILCAFGSECSETGTGGTPSPYQTQPNVFAGTQSSLTSLRWKIPIDPPGVNLTRTISLANVRANVSQLGMPPGANFYQVQATVGIQGVQTVPLARPQQTVALSSQGVAASVVSSASIPQCLAHNAVLLGGSGTAAFDFNIQVQEGPFYVLGGYYDAFTYRNYGTALFGPEFPPVLAEQNLVNFEYGTETGFYSPSLFTAAPTLGLADFGTRFLVSLGPVSAGTKLFVPTTITSGSGTPPLQLQLVQANQSGNSEPGYEPVASSATIGATPVAEASSSGTTAYVVYEVVDASPGLETATIPVAVAFTDVPATGAVNATTTLAPLSSVETASKTASIPRFTSFSTAQEAYSITSCPAP
jgi:hypothetical protein